MIGTVNLATTCVLVAEMVQHYVRSSGGVTKELMSLDFLAAARNSNGRSTCRGTPSQSVCVNTNNVSMGGGEGGWGG